MKKGFTLIELIMVLSIISMMATIAIPSFVSMRQEGMLTKAQQELQVLQAAVEMYRAENNKLPANITQDIYDTKARLLNRKAVDPWKTNGTHYGYTKGVTSEGEDYYLLFSKAFDESIDYRVSGDSIIIKKDALIVSNLPVLAD